MGNVRPCTCVIQQINSNAREMVPRCLGNSRVVSSTDAARHSRILVTLQLRLDSNLAMASSAPSCPILLGHFNKNLMVVEPAPRVQLPVSMHHRMIHRLDLVFVHFLTMLVR